MKRIQSPHARTYLKTGERIVSGMRLADEGRRWMEANEDAFFAILEYCRELRRDGVKGRARDKVATFCCENGIKVGNDGTAFANASWAVIARYIVLLDPELGEYPLTLADSNVDCVGLHPISYLPQLEGRQ